MRLRAPYPRLARMPLVCRPRDFWTILSAAERRRCFPEPHGVECDQRKKSEGLEEFWTVFLNHWKAKTANRDSRNSPDRSPCAPDAISR